MRDPECIFCRIVAGELPATVVASDEHTVSFMDESTRPIPGTSWSSRATTPRDLTERRQRGTLEAVAVAAQRQIAALVSERLDADGINLLNSCGAAAWQDGTSHFHLHVIPRYEGDPLRLPWTPAPGDPDAIAQAAKRLTG